MTTATNEQCPSWCERAHHPDDPPESRFHEQVLGDFAVVVGHRLDPIVPPVDFSEELIVRRVRYFDGPRTWLVMEEAENAARHLMLTVDAAAPLQAALATVTRDLG